MSEPVLDFIIISLPADVDPSDPEVETRLEQVAYRNIMDQYPRKGVKPPRALVISSMEWVFTSDPDVVAQVQPGDGCPTCIAGNDQAQAVLRDDPTKMLALGNITYTEVW